MKPETWLINRKPANFKPPKILDISTAHIKASDNDWLKAQVKACDPSTPKEWNRKSPVLFVEALTYGYLIIGTEDTFENPKLSKPLKAIVDLAVKKKCTFIMIDRDGPLYEELKTYEW